jgi:hypothetical protein
MHAFEALVDYTNPRSLGYRFRSARKHKIVALIDAIFLRKGSVRIADLGGRELYWNIFGCEYLQSRKAHVTLINPERLPLPSSPLFTLLEGDACSLEGLPDNSFDLTHCNSTIEHVGRWDRIEAFARVARRLAQSYYVQTPYFWFPVDPHTVVPLFHWMPESWRIKIALRFMASNFGEAVTVAQYATMLDRAQMKFLFPDAEISFEWFGPFPKSLLAIKQTAS